MKKCTSFEEQKVLSYIQGNIYFGIIIFSCLSSTKPCLRFPLICFARELKGFYQSSFGNKVDFTNIMNVSPNILAKNQNFKKLRHRFADERPMITGKPLYLFISLMQFLLSENFIWKLEKNTSGFLQTMLIQHFKMFIFYIKLSSINQA